MGRFSLNVFMPKIKRINTVQMVYVSVALRSREYLINKRKVLV